MDAAVSLPRHEPQPGASERRTDEPDDLPKELPRPANESNSQSARGSPDDLEVPQDLEEFLDAERRKTFFLSRDRRRRSKFSSGPKDGRTTIVRALDDCPSGYPRLAAFLDSDDNYMIFRRFGYLQARLLLEKQAKLTFLELELDRMDLEDKARNARTIVTAQREGEEGRKREELMESIEKVFCEYSGILTAAQKIRQFEQPTEHDYLTIRNYFWNESPLPRPENKWVSMHEDLVALRAEKEPDWLEQIIQSLLVYFGSNFMKRLFRSHDRAMKAGYDRNIQYFSPERIQKLTTAIIALAVSVLLVLPISLCYILLIYVGGNKAYGACIGIIFFSTLLFSVCTSLFSNAKRSEILAATSAYCAVLVVYLGNVGTS